LPRKLRAAVAQLGPIHLDDSRAAVVKRLIALLREAHAGGAEFVVFPKLALTAFFPRWRMTDQAEMRGSGEFLPCALSEMAKPRNAPVRELEFVTAIHGRLLV